MTNQQPNILIRIPMVGLLAWLLPGLGHLYLGHRNRGLICLITITLTFWTGVAIGGVRGTVNPKEHNYWFVAQLCTAGNTLAAYALSRTIGARSSTPGAPATIAHWSSTDVGVHYTGVAGLLNLLVIFDAIARVQGPVGTGRAVRETSGGVP